MSGLDTSQDVTVEASKHADEHHEHSRKPASDAAAETPTTADGANEGAKD